MGDPWKAEGGPDSGTLRGLVASGLTDKQIGERYGVTRQAVGYWRERYGISRGKRKLLDHSDYLPWTMRSEDHSDSIARRLRHYSTLKQGGTISADDQARLDKFLEFLRSENVVVDYSRDRGFVLRRRQPELDDPDDIIRRPSK